MIYIQHLFTVLGLVFVALLGVGLYLDVADFDKTRGGYEAPYEGVTGEPVDWSTLDRTTTGLVKRGYIVNVHVHGTTGMISFEVFRKIFDFRPFSERALAVHKPREALIALGFTPEF